MIAARFAMALFATGVVLFFSGLFGVPRADWSLYLSGLGLVAVLLGLIALLVSARAHPRTPPHPAVLILSLVAAAIYVYAHPFTEMSLGWSAWASIPYLFCLVVSCFSATHRAAVAGVIAALLFDLYTHYSVAMSKSSTAAIAYIYSPLWNALVFVPLAVFLAWLLLRRSSCHVGNAP